MAAVPSRFENLRNLQVANADVAFATAFGTLVSGSILVGFIQFLGGSDFWIGLLTSVPAFVGILQIPGAVWGRSFPTYQKFITPGGWLWRLLYLPLIALPIVALSGEIRLIILTACIALATAAVQIVTPIYNDWIAEMVPANSRGWYFSRRTLISTIIGMVAGFLGAVLLDTLRDSGREAIGFVTVFAIGAGCGLVSMVFFLRMRDFPRTEPVPASLKTTLRMIMQPVRDKNFRAILIFTAIFMASQGFAGSLFAAFARESLNMSFTVLQLSAVSHALGTIAFVKLWGYLADKYGNKPILLLLTVGTILTPVTWLVCQPDRPIYNATIVIAAHLFNGMVWSGVTVTQLNLYMATAKPEDRANYLGAALAVQALAGGIAPLVGSWMMSVLRASLPVMVAYKWVFVTVMAIRVVATLTLIPVREPGAVSLRSALGQLRRVRPSGARALRAMSAGRGESDRIWAAQELGDAGLSMATDELVAALRDPSPRVRRQAAEALGKIGTDDAATALLKHVLAFPDQIEDETIEALGEAVTPDAVPVLIGFLKDPRALIRRSAARALGKIGSHEALDALAEAAMEPGDTDLRRAAVQALRRLEARESVPVFADALFDSHPSVRIAAAEAVSDLQLTELADSLRRSMEWFDDDAVSEAAYALGCVGEKSDIPTILRAARAAVSGTARRRCLLGIARLLNCEGEAYRLITQQGIARDAMMLALIKPHTRRNPGLTAAIDRYSSGDEPGALRMLAKGSSGVPLQDFAEDPVEEVFLIALLATIHPDEPASG